MSKRRNLYLDNKDLEVAKEEYLKALNDLSYQEELISTIDALDRYSAKAIYAEYSNPSYNSCAMDGIATKSHLTKGASEKEPIILSKDDYMEVDTGDLLRKEYDAVIMAEDLIEVKEGYKIIKPVYPYYNVRSVGEDIVAKEMVLTSFHKITPIDISVLLASGNKEISVIKKVKAGIIPTGDEMITYEDKLEEDKIIDTNSWLFKNLVNKYYGEGKIYPITKDDPKALKAMIKKALAENDMVIISAGSSAGRDDYTPSVIRELGEVYTHGVAIKPGKPVVLGRIDNKPVIGLPGYPVSSYITFMEFVVPVMKLLSGIEYEEYPEVKAILTKTLMSSLKYREYVRVKLGIVEDKLIATPLKRGAGASMSLVRADGFCVIPQDLEGLLEGEEVAVRLSKDLKVIADTLVIIGSHDLILDVIRDIMIQKHSGIELSSSHVGSLSGLIALSKKETHLTPSHLLDEASGVYNIPIIKAMFKDEKMAIIKGVKRRQGFITKKGNPLNIQTISDLKRVSYINRQKGAGTRVLLDHLLKLNGISKEAIIGYEHEVNTHMAVAISVKNGDADTGMGVYSAAKALDLDFIDIAYEEYDFVTYASYLNDPKVKWFIEVLKSEEFIDEAKKLGGYTLEECGKVILL